MQIKSRFLLIRKRSLKRPYFSPKKCAEYYESPIGSFAAQRIREEIDFIFTDRVLRRDIRKFIFSLESSRILIIGFGYTAPFMETLENIFYQITQHKNYHGKIYSLTTYSTLSLIPPFTRNLVYTENDLIARKIGASYKTRVIGVLENSWCFLDNTVPIVFIIHGFEGVNKPLEVLKEANRVLVKDGELFIVFPHLWTFWLYSERFIYDGQRRYSIKEMTNILKEQGFKVVGFQIFGGYPPWWGNCKTYKTNSGEVSKRLLYGRVCNFLSRTLSPLFGGLVFMRAKKIHPQRDEK